MPPPTPYARVWLLFVLAWVSNYLVRMGFSALLPSIMHDLALSYTRAGVLTSAFFGAYAAMQFPAGLLGDRFGRRRVLLVGLLAGALASVSTGFAVSFATLLAARLATGIAQGSLFSNDRAIIVAVTPPAKMALGQAVSFLGPGLGLSLGLVVGGFLGELMPWRGVFVVLALPSVAAALLIARLVPASAGPRPPGAGVRDVVGQPDLWLLGLAGAAAMWVQYTLATWAPLLFMEAGVTELGRAGLYSSLMGLAGVGGLLIGGGLGDRARRFPLGRKGVLAISLGTLTAATLVLSVVVQRRPSVPALAAGLGLVAICAWSIWGPSFALLSEVFTGRDLATAFGLYNTVCVLGAVIGPGLTGWARDVTGTFVAGCYLSVAAALAGAIVVLQVRARPAGGPGGRGL
jgi:predicted MFS family arabinose efflux permease